MCAVAAWLDLNFDVKYNIRLASTMTGLNHSSDASCDSQRYCFDYGQSHPCHLLDQPDHVSEVALGSKYIDEVGLYI